MEHGLFYFSLVVSCAHLGAACLYDYGTGRIPNPLVLSMGSFGVIFAFLADGPMGVIYFCCKILLVWLCLFALFRIGVLGAGDLKLFGVCAGYLYLGDLFSFWFLSMLLSAAISLCKMIANKTISKRVKVFARFLDRCLKNKAVVYYHEESPNHRDSICMAGPIFLSFMWVYWKGGFC